MQNKSIESIKYEALQCSQQSAVRSQQSAVGTGKCYPSRFFFGTSFPKDVTFFFLFPFLRQEVDEFLRCSVALVIFIINHEQEKEKEEEAHVRQTRTDGL